MILKLREHFVTLATGLKRRSQVRSHRSRVAGYGSRVTDMIIINSNYFNDVKVIEYPSNLFCNATKTSTISNLREVKITTST